MKVCVPHILIEKIVKIEFYTQGLAGNSDISSKKTDVLIFTKNDNDKHNKFDL